MLQAFRETRRKSEGLEISFAARRRFQTGDRQPRSAYKTRIRPEPGDSIVRLCRIRRRRLLTFSQVSLFLRTILSAVRDSATQNRLQLPALVSCTVFTRSSEFPIADSIFK